MSLKWGRICSDEASVGFMISIYDYVIFVKKPGPVVFIISIISDEFIPFFQGKGESIKTIFFFVLRNFYQKK